MLSKDSDEDMYITQATFRQEHDLVGEDSTVLSLDGLSTVEPVLNIDCTKENPAARNPFASPVSDIEILWKVRDTVPKATSYKDKWAVNLFECWQRERKERVCNFGEVNDGQLKIVTSLEDMPDE